MYLFIYLQDVLHDATTHLKQSLTCQRWMESQADVTSNVENTTDFYAVPPLH